MAHLVKCPLCGESFDRDKNVCVEMEVNHRIRYAHKKCVEDGKSISLTKPAVVDFMFTMLGGKNSGLTNANYAYMMKQLNWLLADGNYTLEGIYNTIQYIYKIKGRSFEYAKTAFFNAVPKFYQEAQDFVNVRKAAKEHNLTIDVKEITNKQTEIVAVAPPKVNNRRKKIIDF